MNSKYLIIYITFISIVLGQDEGRIFGGSPVESSETYPWMVALIKEEADTPLEGQYCGGSLIAPNWVLTAAHCVIFNGELIYQPDEMYVLLGTNSLVDLEEGEIRFVDNMIPYPDYPIPGLYLGGDLALLHLTEEASNISIPIVDNPELDQVETGITLGWGVTEETVEPVILLEAEGPISHEICIDCFGEGFYSPEFHLCFGGYESGVGPGDDDSGGPMIVFNELVENYFLAGVVSGGCVDSPDPSEGIFPIATCYTRIYTFFDWIHETMNSVNVTFKNIDEYGNNIGGTLEVSGLYHEIISGDTKLVPSGIEWDILTHSEILYLGDISKKHIKWNNMLSDYFLTHERVFYLDAVDLAIFNIIGPIIIESNIPNFPISLEIHDPWYVEPEVSPNAGEQLDTFHTLENPEYWVFLNQNQLFLDGYPTYSIKAPDETYVTTDGIYQFKHWQVLTPAGEEVDNSEDNSFAFIHSYTQPETMVSFLQENVTVRAVYEAVNLIEYFTLEIPIEESIHIPENANIQFAEGFTFDVFGELDIDGNEEGIVFSALNERWKGIITNEGSSLTMNNVFVHSADSINCKDLTQSSLIQNTTFTDSTSVFIYNGKPVFDNCSFVDNHVSLWVRTTTTPVATPEIRDCIFSDNFMAMVVADHSIPIMHRNQFINNDNGLYVGYYGSPYLFLYDSSLSESNNVFSNNDYYGVITTSGGRPWLGIYADGLPVFEGRNRFYDNGSLDVWNAHNFPYQYPIYAQPNHWQFNSGDPCASGTPNIELDGSVIWEPTLSDIYDSCPQLGDSVDEIAEIPDNSTEDYLIQIEYNPDTDLAHWLVSGVVHNYEIDGQSDELMDVLGILEEEYPETKTSKFAKTHKITQKILSKEYDVAESLIDQFEEDYGLTELTSKHLYEKTIIEERGNDGLGRNSTKVKELKYELLSLFPNSGYSTLINLENGDVDFSFENTETSIKSLPTNFNISIPYSNLTHSTPLPISPMIYLKICLCPFSYMILQAEK